MNSHGTGRAAARRSLRLPFLPVRVLELLQSQLQKLKGAVEPQRDKAQQVIWEFFPPFLLEMA